MKVQNSKVKNLLDEIYKIHLSIPNFLQLITGKYQPVNRFPDKSFKTLLKNKTIHETLLNKIDAVRAQGNYSNYDNLTLDLAEYFVNYILFPVSPLMEPYYYLEFGLTPYEFSVEIFWNSLSLFDCSTPETVQKHMKLCKDFVRFTQDMRSKLFEQAKRGIYLFSEVIPSTCQMFRSYAETPYEKHPFTMQRAGSAATEEQIKIETSYIQQTSQAFLDIVDFLESETYQQNAPKGPGWAQFEHGLEYYRYLRNFHLGYDITALELHNLGKERYQQAVKEQTAIRSQLGYVCSHEEFLEILKGNDRFYPQTPERLGELMNGVVRHIANSMTPYFNETIKTPYRVERLDPKLEESLTFGYFQPSSSINQAGIYYFNGSGLEEKCQLTLPSLLAHEIIPGHHFQQSYMSENEDLHPLFQLMFAPSCLEGWAEYSAFFLIEAGIFDDYDNYGRLENDKFACARLIVDTGLNELGWNMEQARSFMEKNTFATRQMVMGETIRYTYCIPGQCLSYKHGSYKMTALRDRFMAAKGENADIREFHSLVLNTGCIPMPLLETFVNNEIQADLETK